jgi:hypothetical protein
VVCILDVTDGVYSNKLEFIDCCELATEETSETGLEWLLRVELGGGTGGMRNNAGVRIEVVTLLRDLEDVDIGVDDGEAVTLDAVVVVRDDTEETVVDLGWRLAELLLEIDWGEEGRLGVLMGLAVGDLLAIDMVRNCVGITLVSEDKVAEVTLIPLMASGIVPTTEGVGIP